MKVVLLLSGGLDSTTALYYLKSQGHDVMGLAIDYGQRHSKELLRAREIASQAEIEFEIADLSPLRKFLSSSSQTSSDIPVPEGHYTESSMKLTVVPNRNMIMLSIATGWAINMRADAVAYAAHSGDHTIYPDCRPEFVVAMNHAMQLSDWHSIELLTPFVGFTKSKIVNLAQQLKVPLELTWSCYKGGEHHCGKCGTCTERREAFALASVKDPTVYEQIELLGVI